ncbi:MAG: hypothetical protein M1814_003784 [Vezdaea aestivalis]|nr:MAG: hypothetical protein M1814_003784 [Vezdaea aestivalis]
MRGSPEAESDAQFWRPAAVSRSESLSGPSSTSSAHPFFPRYADFSSGASSARYEPLVPSVSDRPSQRQANLSPSSSAAAATKSKPIRFINITDGQPHVKRRRIHTACKTCRRKKTRCSGEHPVCETCSLNGHDCQGYTESPDRQKGKPIFSGSESPEKEADEDLNEADVGGNISQDEVHSLVKGKRRESSLKATSRRSSQDLPRSISPLTARRNDKIESILELPTDQSPLFSTDYSAPPTPAGNKFSYLRYFGPTAIIPGFQQMSVRIKDKPRKSAPASATPYPSTKVEDQSLGKLPEFVASATPIQPLKDPTKISKLLFYNPASDSPNPSIIDRLTKTFFDRLGSNFPFLHREKFLKDVAEKRAESMLVDSVCAIAARFSDLSLFSNPFAEAPLNPTEQTPRSEYGDRFAGRVKAAVMEALTHPTITTIQACLLLAYDEFGSDHDSGLWMYLGISIRMAQDIGLQKFAGLGRKSCHKSSPNPTEKDPGIADSRRGLSWRPKESSGHPILTTYHDGWSLDEERSETFWAVFFLDRVTSSATGRPMTFRDDDIDISLPVQEGKDDSGWPAPYQSLIRIIQLYGRVSDFMNKIGESNDITSNSFAPLASMEKEFSAVHQQIPQQLQFNASNFEHYIQIKHASTFVLLHVWFHTLIILLHQPAILYPFGGMMQRILPNSHEIALNSAKAITDILSFAALTDRASLTSNPFVSQPIYIAACAFLNEISLCRTSTSAPSAPSSYLRATKQLESANLSNRKEFNTQFVGKAFSNQGPVQRRQPFATTERNLQMCHNALKMLEPYWAGTKYITNALSQKMRASIEPPLSVPEDSSGATAPSHTTPAFTTPKWRPSQLSVTASTPSKQAVTRNAPGPETSTRNQFETPQIGPALTIGWVPQATGIRESFNASFLDSSFVDKSYQYGQPTETPRKFNKPSYSKSSIVGSIPADDMSRTLPSSEDTAATAPHFPMVSRQLSDMTTGAEVVGNSLAPSHFNASSLYSSISPTPFHSTQPFAPTGNASDSYNYTPSQQQLYDTSQIDFDAQAAPILHPGGGMIHTADVDLNVFENEMVPWLEGYLPQDSTGFYDQDVIENLGQEQAQSDSPKHPTELSKPGSS